MEEVDKSNMRQVIVDFPKQFRAGLLAAADVKPPVKIRAQNVIIAGMGGSALPGELLKLFSAHFKWGIKASIHRNYGLPALLNTKSPGVKPLILCISYSGNTEETISAYAEAKKYGLPLIAVATGGELARLAKKDKTPLALIQSSNIQPRSATGYLFAAALKILANARMIEPQDAKFLALEKSLKPLALESRGKDIAKELKHKIPVIYAAQNYKALAYIWKIKFNETGKTPAFCNYFPELNHNEMVGYTNDSFKDCFYPIFLRSHADHPRIKKRMNLTAETIGKRGFKLALIDLKGEGLYNSVFNTILLADWASYYLALKYGTDPTPVHIIEEFKKQL